MNERDFVLLQLMRDEADVVIKRLTAVSGEPQFADQLSIDALAYAMHRLALSAERLSPACRTSLPQIAWTLLIETGLDTLKHYDTFDLENLWNVATNLVPVIYDDLQRLIENTPVDDIEANPALRVSLVVARERVGLSYDEIAAFCRKHRIRKLSLFGSVLRDDLTPESDIDVLADFEPEFRYSLLDLVEIEQELCDAVGRKVDFVEIGSLNKYMKDRVLRQAATLYERSQTDLVKRNVDTHP